MWEAKLNYYYLKLLVACHDWRDARKRLVRWLIILSVTLAIFVWLALAWRGLNISTWGDEKTTYNMIAGTWSALADQLLHDYHPPGFYVAIKTWWTGCQILLPKMPFALAAKFFCYLPSFILAGVGAFFFYKRTQKLLPAIAWTWWILTGPLFLPYSFEIRMYSWAATGVSLAFFAALLVRENDRWYWWGCLSLASLLALYSQYYAGISIVIIWLWLYADSHYRHHQRHDEYRSHWWRTGWISVIAYSPALYFLNNQVPRLGEHPLGTQTFPLTLASSWHFWGALVTPSGLAPPVSSHLYGWSWWSTIALVVVIATFAWLRPKRWSAAIFGGILVYALTLLFGLVGYTRNIPLMPRYLFPAAGPLLAALMFCLDCNWYQVRTREWLTAMSLLAGIFIIGCINVSQFWLAESAYTRDAQTYQELLQTHLSDPEALTVVDATWVCQIDDLYYGHPADNLNCLSYDDVDFEKQFQTALADKKHLYVANYFYNCTEIKARFENQLGKTSQRVFFSPLLSSHCQFDDYLCEWELVSPQCLYLFELEPQPRADTTL